jgi:hypothetical protein
MINCTKKVDKVKRLLVSVLCGVCVLSCVACQPKETPSSDIHSTKVIRSAIQEYGPYVYADGKAIRRYNRSTNLFAPACMDPECDGTCPLDKGVTRANQLVDGRLYFYSYQYSSNLVQYGYQDIITGDVTVLVTLSEKEDSVRWSSFVWDDYMYYTRRLLREGGAPEDPGDYIDHICRISVDGGEEEAFIETTEPILMVADGKIVTMQDGNVNTYDVKTGEKVTLFNMEDKGYKNIAGKISFTKGKLYFMCRGNSYCTSEYRRSSHPYQFLVSVDIQTGEVKKAIENPVISYVLTDDTIYYAPFELRHMYIPDDYEQYPENVAIFLASATLYACDIDGGNHRAVYTNETMDYIEDFTVIDDTLYGWLYDFDEVNHMFGDAYFGKIDFKTGEVTPAQVEE